ncbi:MAG: PPK2 family polyphosphate kinase [Eubacteriales bacterium]
MFKKYTVSSRKKVLLKEYDPEDSNGFIKEEIAVEYNSLLESFAELQEVLYASKQYGLLILLQGMDCSGKDGTVRNVLASVNPGGVVVESFKVPTPEELGHGYLWRIQSKVPKKGEIVVFNRSYYEDVLVTRVHKLIDDETAERRFKEIGNYEKYLHYNNTIVLKFFLHISKDFQQKKLMSRLESWEKNWKFSEDDLKERKFWDKYQQFYGEVLSNCGSKEVPWYIVPANHRWFRDYFILKVIVNTLKELNLKYPRMEGNVQALIDEVMASK